MRPSVGILPPDLFPENYKRPNLYLQNFSAFLERIPFILSVLRQLNRVLDIFRHGGLERPPNQR